MASSSQASQLSSQELNSLVNDAVIYILSQSHTKYPIKRPDIVKNVLKTYSRSCKQVLQEAAAVLRKTFGMDLLEVDHRGAVQQYILVNGEQCLMDVDKFQYSEEEKAQIILLMMVLSLIYMNGGVMREEVLYNCLTKKLGIISAKNDIPHPFFGDVKKLLTQEFVRQLYLEHNRLPDQDPPKYEFRWGKRAEAEGRRRHMLQFVCKMYNTTNLALWTTQYQEMLRSEGKTVTEDNEVIECD